MNSKYEKMASNYSLKFDGGVLLRYFVMLRLVALRFSLPCCLRSVTTFLVNFRYLNNSSFCLIYGSTKLFPAHSKTLILMDHYNHSASVDTTIIATV